MRPRPGRAPPGGVRERRRRWRRWVLGLGVPLVVVALIVVLTVYTQITLTFEGRLWTLPARVYSAPAPPRCRARRSTRSALVGPPRPLRLRARRTRRRRAPASTESVPEAIDLFVRGLRRAGRAPSRPTRGPRVRRRRRSTRSTTSTGAPSRRSTSSRSFSRWCSAAAGRADDRPARRGAEEFSSTRCSPPRTRASIGTRVSIRSPCSARRSRTCRSGTHRPGREHDHAADREEPLLRPRANVVAQDRVKRSCRSSSTPATRKTASSRCT